MLPPDSTCKFCGREFDPTGRPDPDDQFCSDECEANWWDDYDHDYAYEEDHPDYEED